MLTYKLHLMSTFAMCGIIWIIQIIHYPLFNLIAKEKFKEYLDKHSFRITFIVGPLMILELFTGVALYLKPFKLSHEIALIGLILIFIIWISTVVIQSPQFTKLENEFNEKDLGFLVNSNWIRTVCWTIRSFILILVS